MIYEDQDSREDYPEHQLMPQMGGRYTVIFHGPPGTDVGSLCCELIEDESGHVVNSSGWKPDETQVAMLEAGAHVRVSLWTHPIPPMAVCVEPPVCACHLEPMAFDSEGPSFYCSKIRNLDSNGDGLDAAKRDFTPED